ncbi:cytochrome c [Altererythrobacter sp. KTW20L]|uniref:c-type cytochrome n=1 Tax=Altererythrobacter sp. KTW20L TaxID=2942210 RepID=UPI0020BDA7D3|nr:cytochrome c [Altererythrobacter sp. KTW20L]MCL6250796.1 cytochrome c [Altererythrobacter sp. KTW20L]
MLQRFVPPALPVAALCLLLAACGDSGEAPDQTAVADAEFDVIDQRQNLLEGIGDSFRAIRGQMEGSPDFAVITTSAQTINTNAVQIIDLFPAGTGIDSGADTEALAVIWEDPDGFAAAHQRLVAASETMLEAAASNDPAMVEAAVGTLGASCQNCHDTYRLDDE